MDRTWNTAVLIIETILVAGCAAGESRTTSTVPVWELTQRLEIGAVEGDDAYEFANVVGSLVLENGEILVADGRSNELRFFDRTGQHVRTAGGRGSGPGEFQWLTRIYQHGPDSLLVADFGKVGVVLLDMDGTYVRMAPADSISGDSVFQLDVWLYRDFWIEGGLHSKDRIQIVQLIDNLPAFDDGTPYRFARRDANGNLWIREPYTQARSSWMWTVVDPSGVPVGQVEIPHSFTIQDIGEDYVVGRWRDDDDVEFVRVYGIQPQDAEVSLPTWYSSTLARQVRSADDTEVVEIRSLLRQLVGAQERYFAANRSYTSDVSELELEIPEGLVVEIVFAFPMGWSAAASYAGSGRVCGMAVGLATPPGWSEGAARCG